MFLYRAPIQLINYAQASYDERINDLLLPKEKPGVISYILSKDIFDNRTKQFPRISKKSYKFIGLSFNINFSINEFISDIYPLGDGFFLVSKSFKGLVETLDPDKNNFWDVDIISNSDDAIKKEFHLMQVGRVFVTNSFVSALTPTKAIEFLLDEMTIDDKETIKNSIFTVLGGNDFFVMSDNFLSAAIEKDIEGLWLMGSNEEKTLGHSSLIRIEGV